MALIKILLKYLVMMFERFLFNKDFFEIVKKKREILDYSLIDKAFDIHNFFKSYHVCKQIAYAYYDLEIHNLETIIPIEELDEMFEDIVNKCIPAGMLPYKNTLFQFDHVFSSGYDTYYYCYVLADFYGSF